MGPPMPACSALTSSGHASARMQLVEAAGIVVRLHVAVASLTQPLT